jgi:hypothetical protein
MERGLRGEDKRLCRHTLSNHAREEAERRGIPLDVLQSVMEAPEQIVAVHSQRRAYQSKVMMDGKLYVVRAIVELTDPLTVVTVYRTSKIEKYWSSEP